MDLITLSVTYIFSININYTVSFDTWTRIVLLFCSPFSIDCRILLNVPGSDSSGEFLPGDVIDLDNLVTGATEGNVLHMVTALDSDGMAAFTNELQRSDTRCSKCYSVRL